MKYKKYLENLVENEIDYRKYALAILKTDDVSKVSEKEKTSWHERHTKKLIKAERVLSYLSDKF